MSKTVPLMAMLLCSITGAVVAQIKDQERVIDVQALSTAIQAATSPITQRMRQSQLQERFDEVTSVMQQDEIDKAQMIDALKGLKSEMDTFIDNWDEVIDPLWSGQEKIAGTADHIRMLLAKGPTGQPSEKTQQLLAGYDARLSGLAKTIKKEGDEDRKARLKLVFSNVLALRKLIEQAGQVNLDPAHEAVYIKVVSALTNLETQLTAATFQIERARVLLASQSDFVGHYIEIMAGIIEAEQLAAILGDMRAAGDGVGPMAFGIGDLTTRIEVFAEMMDGFASKLADTIEAETDEATQDVLLPELDGLNIDAEIDQYAQSKSLQ